MKNALIVDDEPLARRRLKRLLEATGQARVLAACRNSDEALAVLREQASSLDVVFLDLRMPGLDGFELIEAFGRNRFPPVVFVTAHDEHAVRAFEMEAVDYVLKPVDESTLRRALSRLAPTDAATLERLARDLLCAFERGAPGEGAPRFRVKQGERTLFVPVESVNVIRAEGNYARLVTASEAGEGERSYLLRETMARLVERLDPAQFHRVGRSVIVRLEAVRELDPLPGGRLCVRLRNGAEIAVSRRYRRELERRLGL